MSKAVTNVDIMVACDVVPDASACSLASIRKYIVKILFMIIGITNRNIFKWL